MELHWRKVKSVVIILIFVNLCHSSRVHDRIYEEVEGDKSCIKRFNGTHEIGCTSSFWGNVGVLQLVTNMTELDWVIDHGEHAPYVVAMIPRIFSPEAIRKLSISGKLSGIVLLQTDMFERPISFSGDQKCPNRQASFYLTTSYKDYCPAHPWNPMGTSVLYENYDFPIFLIKDEKSVENIVSCYKNFNLPVDGASEADWPLCAIELKSNMKGTSNSEVCMRRSQKTIFAPPDINFSSSFCDPLEDENLWATFLPLNSSVPIAEKSIILVSAAADASSMFDNISPGANAAISGLVTLLLTAEALNRNFDTEVDVNDKNIMFAIFEGEAWEYIGSSRMVYDMVEGKFPYANLSDEEDHISQVNLSHFDSVIDIRQVGQMNVGKSLFLHTDPISNNDGSIDNRTSELVTLLIKNGGRVKFSEANPNNPLPPSSFQSFLKEVNLSGVVIADHKEDFHNQYYQSIFDDDENVDYQSLANGTIDDDQLHKDLADLASSLAKSLYYLLTGHNKDIEPDYEISNQLLYCYLKNTNCSLFRSHSDEHINYLRKEPAKMYVSVLRGEIHLSYITGRILSHFLGKEVDVNKHHCLSNKSQVFTYEYFPYMNNGTCIKSTKHSSRALSPAFIIDDYDWESGKYSTWTESSWALTSARIFLRPSPLGEIGLLLAGVFSLFLSSIIIYFLHSRSDIIFTSEATPVPC